jgi:hypothetical protein
MPQDPHSKEEDDLSTYREEYWRIYKERLKGETHQPKEIEEKKTEEPKWRSARVWATEKDPSSPEKLEPREEEKEKTYDAYLDFKQLGAIPKIKSEGNQSSVFILDYILDPIAKLDEADFLKWSYEIYQISLLPAEAERFRPYFKIHLKSHIALSGKITPVKPTIVAEWKDFPCPNWVKWAV